LNNKNAIHYVVNPHNYGSFENVKILNMLLKNPNHGFDIYAVDKNGKNPLDYALL
jgi:Ankyrin repeats (many copies)